MSSYVGFTRKFLHTALPEEPKNDNLENEKPLVKKKKKKKRKKQRA